MKDGGMIWEVISLDFMINKDVYYDILGGFIQYDYIGVELYIMIFVFEEFLYKVGEFWVGIDDG